MEEQFEPSLKNKVQRLIDLSETPLPSTMVCLKRDGPLLLACLGCFGSDPLGSFSDCVVKDALPIRSAQQVENFFRAFAVRKRPLDVLLYGSKG
jgi:hypothetical protein